MFDKDSPVMRYGLPIAALLGVAGTAYWLSRDAVTYDSWKHSVSNLRKLVFEMYLEHATLYCQKLNQIRIAKEEGRFNSEFMDKLTLD